MQGATVEVGQVEGEFRGAADTFQRLGEQRQQRGRGRHTHVLTVRLETVPLRRVEFALNGAETWLALGRAVRQWQLRCARQLFQRVLPVAPGLSPLQAVALCQVSHHVVAEGQFQRLECLAGVGAGQIVHHHLEALHVEQQQVEVHVQTAMPGVEFADRDFKQRPAVGGQDAIGHVFTNVQQALLLLFSGQVAQVVAWQAIPGRVVQNALAAVTIDHHAQHVMTGDQCVPGLLEAGQVEVGVSLVPFKQHMAGHAAVVDQVGAAQPVSVLDRCQRERLEAAIGLRHDDSVTGCKRRFFGAGQQQCAQAANAQVAVRLFGVQTNAQLALDVAAQLKE